MIKVVAGDTERVTSSNETLAFAASIYGAVCSLSLAIYKFIIAEKLESAIVFVGKYILYFVPRIMKNLQ